MPINYSKYPPNWKTEIRPRILARSNNKCECCGFENGETVYAFTNPFTGKIDWQRLTYSQIQVIRNPQPRKVVLTIAHLDHDEENHNVTDDRLKAMCQLCHLRYDAKEKSKRRLAKQ